MGIDFYPTLLDIADIGEDSEQSPKVDGVSFRLLLENPDRTLDRDLFWHFPHYHAGGDSPYSAIRSKNWRLVEFHEDGALDLYNLNDDIDESNNLAVSNPEIAGDLHTKLSRWRQDVGAQMPSANANFDPTKQHETAKRTKPAVSALFE